MSIPFCCVMPCLCHVDTLPPVEGWWCARGGRDEVIVGMVDGGLWRGEGVEGGWDGGGYILGDG